jgi:Calx-beta domain-containing protein
MIRTRRTLAGLGALALTLGVPAGLVLATSQPASACIYVASGAERPLCGGGISVWFTATATPATTAPADPVTLSMAEVIALVPTDVTAQTVFSMDSGTCTGRTCTSDVPGTHLVTANYTGTSATGTATTTVTVLTPDHLVVSPVYTTASAGQTITYTVTRATADGTVIDDVSGRATITLGGVPCPGAVCTAALAGEQLLTATYDGMTAGGAVMVQPAVAAAYLVITPQVNGFWNNIWAATFTAEAYDVGGNDLGPATAKAGFSISPDGTCTANSCTPATGGSHTVTAIAGAVRGSTTLDAGGPVPLIAPSLPAGQVGSPYSSSVLSWDGAGPSRTQLEVHSSTPPGLTLGTDGVLSGTPTAAGTYFMRIDTTNANGTNEKDTTITVAPAPAPTGKPAVSAAGATVTEGNSGRKTVLVTVRLSAASSTPVTVAWHTANGTAIAGKDYVAARGTVTIPAGQLTATIPVSVIGDRVKEKNETFTVVLATPHGATLGTARGIVTIANDD